jgi:hypothetical protein
MWLIGSLYVAYIWVIIKDGSKLVASIPEVDSVEIAISIK